MSGEKIWLNVGCGSKALPGFINVDIQQLPGVDEVADATKLSAKFGSNFANLIYSCHMLEHIDRREVINVLRDWYKVLVPGGILRLAVPDFEAITKWYRDTRDVDSVIGLTVGGNKDAFDNHKCLFDHTKLENMLEDAGFVAVRRYDWQQTMHKDHDDYSQAYLPHMQKETGTLMSLNLEAMKPDRDNGWGARIKTEDPILTGVGRNK